MRRPRSRPLSGQLEARIIRKNLGFGPPEPKKSQVGRGFPMKIVAKSRFLRARAAQTSYFTRVSATTKIAPHAKTTQNTRFSAFPAALRACLGASWAALGGPRAARRPKMAPQERPGEVQEGPRRAQERPWSPTGTGPEETRAAAGRDNKLTKGRPEPPSPEPLGPYPTYFPSI